jgi:IS30 family transposase
MNEDFISCRRAARMMNRSPQTIHNAMKRGTMKSVLINGKRRTTAEWVDEFSRKPFDQQRATRNNKRVYDDDSGLFSIARAAIILNIGRMAIYKYIYRGQISTIKEGKYHVLTPENLRQIAVMRQSLYVRKKRSNHP